MKQKHHVMILPNNRVATLSECTVRQASQFCKASGAKLVCSFDDALTAWAYRCKASKLSK